MGEEERDGFFDCVSVVCEGFSTSVLKKMFRKEGHWLFLLNENLYMASWKLSDNSFLS